MAGNNSLHADELVRAGITEDEIFKLADLYVKKARLVQHRTGE